MFGSLLLQGHFHCFHLWPRRFFVADPCERGSEFCGLVKHGKILDFAERILSSPAAPCCMESVSYTCLIRYSLSDRRCSGLGKIFSWIHQFFLVGFFPLIFETLILFLLHRRYIVLATGRVIHSNLDASHVIYIYVHVSSVWSSSFSVWRRGPKRTRASSFTKFLDHSQAPHTR